MKYSNAGHDWPFHIAADASLTRLQTGGLMLGLFEEHQYEDDHIVFHPGELLVIQSDGITEALNAEMEEFGEQRLKELLLAVKDLSASEIIDTVIREVRKHAGANLQSDDITIMAIKRIA
jgi:sigma-B regulation protein RsbU (phosphoserine phosphatase)